MYGFNRSKFQECSERRETIARAWLRHRGCAVVSRPDDAACESLGPRVDPTRLWACYAMFTHTAVLRVS